MILNRFGRSRNDPLRIPGRLTEAERGLEARLHRRSPACDRGHSARLDERRGCYRQCCRPRAGLHPSRKNGGAFPVSTSKFGTGDGIGTYRTPLGETFVSAKFGDRLPTGAVIKNRTPTGEIVNSNATGRDAIVTRVIWLRGMETGNRNARERCIYIHGTAEERRIGRRASYGCIRMRSKDVIALDPLVQALLNRNETNITDSLLARGAKSEIDECLRQAGRLAVRVKKRGP